MVDNERSPPAADIDALRAELAAERGAHALARDRLAEVTAAELAERTESVRLRSLVAEHRNRAAALEIELSRLRSSLTWRMTSPLRRLGEVMSVSGQRVRSLLFGRHSGLRTLARQSLVAALAAVRRVPRVKPIVYAAARVVPGLEPRLRSFARARSSGSAGAGASVLGAAGGHLPPLATFRDTPIEPRHEGLCRPLPAGRRSLYFYVDHTVLCPVNTGMQRVTRGLARALIDAGERLVFVKWDPARRQLVLVNRDELVHLSRWQGPALNAAAAARYPAAGLEGMALDQHDRDEGHWLVVPEVTYITFHQEVRAVDVIIAAKQTGLRSAFVFYDAIPLRRTDLAASAAAHEAYMQQLLLADLVVPISQWSGSDLRSFLQERVASDLDPSPIVEVLALPGESQLGERVTTISEQPRRMILSVGTIEPRKNQLALVAAFEQFCARYPGSGWELMLVGNIHAEVADELAKAARRTPAIRTLAHLPDEDLHKLMLDAAFTVFASVEEGFGLPILESLWHGRPCICANFGAMAEVATGGGCLQIDTRDVGALLAAIETMAFDAEARSRLTSEAIRRPLLSWRQYGRQFSQLFDRMTDPMGELGTIYYCVEHTGTFAHNTGIQRVVRGLARALIEAGCRLVPVRWDGRRHCLYRPLRAELEHLALWNGPSPDGWHADPIPSEFRPSDWMVMPELPVYPGGPDPKAIKSFSRASGLRVAWVFYDAIPWKMRDLYAPQWSLAHAQYMTALAGFERVLAISENSARDLRRFLATTSDRTPDLEHRVLACPLPGEFRESARIVSLAPERSGPVTILSVGSVEPRKNHTRLLHAFVMARETSDVVMELVLAGGCHLPEPAASEFRRLVAATPGVRWEENTDDVRLRELYDDCDFTVYPSLEEGFGLPIVESLWNARPCICRNQGALAEVAHGGGCLTVDTEDPEAIAAAIAELAGNAERRQQLAREAVARPFRTWADYARDVITLLVRERFVPRSVDLLPPSTARARLQAMPNLGPAPLLSICITTFNRAGWLALSLKNLERLLPAPRADVEIVVCDNTSTDGTPQVVEPYLGRADFRYRRNPANVGMLGNLQVTAHEARGRFVWVLGDDDLVKPGAIEHLLSIIRDRPDLALIYLNYAYTREDDAAAVTNLDHFLAHGTPIVAPGPDVYAPIRQIAAKSENFFTAIYCLVFRRDHALRAYSQDTQGRPFSSMLTSIPTTYHVLHRMMNEPGCWVGTPQLVVNMNVSWVRYAALWVLERLPEMFDRAEAMGADGVQVDHWRAHNLPGLVHYFQEILENDPDGNLEFFDPARLVTRLKHVEAFRREVPALKLIYQRAQARGCAAARVPVDEVFAAFAQV